MEREAAEAQRLADKETQGKEQELEDNTKSSVGRPKKGFDSSFLLFCCILFCVLILMVFAWVIDSNMKAAEEAAVAQGTAAAEATSKASEEVATAHAAVTEEVRRTFEAAKDGDAEAQNKLGYFYYNRRGVQGWTEGPELHCVDGAACDQKAVTWYAKAAKQENADAQANLGRMYYNGRGVRGRTEGEELNCTDDEDCAREAVAWFAKAANQGHRTAMMYLATMYRNQRGVTTIDDPALRCNDKASCEAKAKALDEQREALSP
ncbi:MAG: sel1 repeat family protein [Rhodobacter sp.]|nr:sel1 repeat family protein [Rhodobacter sp.]